MKAKKAKLRLEVFKAKNGEWCYRIKSRNGNELFRASETYKRKVTMIRGLARMFASIRANSIEVIDFC